MVVAEVRDEPVEVHEEAGEVCVGSEVVGEDLSLIVIEMRHVTQELRDELAEED